MSTQDNHQVQQNICRSLAITLSHWTRRLSAMQERHHSCLKQVQTQESMRQSVNNSMVQ